MTTETPAERRADLADAVTAETKRLMERRTTTLRKRAELAETRVAKLEATLREVLDTFGPMHEVYGGPVSYYDGSADIEVAQYEGWRAVLGTTEQAGTEAAPVVDRRERYAAAIREADGWVLDDGQHMVDAVMAVADGEQAALRAEVEGLDEALRGAIAVSEKDGARLRAEMERRTLMLQAGRDQVAKLGTTITRLRAERTELSRQLDCSRGDMRDMESHVREQDAEFERLRLAAEAQQPTPAPAEAHACDNCDGIDPDTCLMNPRPTVPAVSEEPK